MKRIITVGFAAATLLVGGMAVAHDSKTTADGKSSCPMHAKADAKATATAEAAPAKAEGMSCHTEKAGTAKTAHAEGMDCCKKDAAKTAAKAATESKHDHHAAPVAAHADHHAKGEHAAAGKHEGCDMTKKTAGKDGMACCEKHKNAAAPEAAPAPADAPSPAPAPAAKAS